MKKRKELSSYSLPQHAVKFYVFFRQKIKAVVKKVEHKKADDEGDNFKESEDSMHGANTNEDDHQSQQKYKIVELADDDDESIEAVMRGEATNEDVFSVVLT